MFHRKINIFSGFVSLIFGLLLFPSNLKSILIFLFGLFFIYRAVIKKVKFDLHFFLNYSAIYIFMLITVFYSNDIKQASMHLQTMSTLIVFPFIFSLIKKEDYLIIYKNLNLYFWIYIISILLFHLIVFFWFSIFHFTLLETIEHYQEIINLHLGKFSIHPIYLSIHCCIGLFFSYFLLQKQNIKFNKLLIIFFQILLIIFLILHSKKGPVFSFLITLIVYFLIYKKRIVKPLILIITLIVLFLSIPKFQNRIVEITKIENLNSSNFNSTNVRFTIYKNALELIKRKPFFGYSIGDYNDKLKENYSQNHLDVLLEKDYNSHNQYLSFILIGGVFLFIIYMVFLFKNISESYKKENNIFILLIIFYSFTMFTENILERENGVIFFSFFLCFFGYRNKLNY